MALLISQSYAYAFVPCEPNEYANTSRQHIDDTGAMPHNMLESDMPKHMRHNVKQNTKQNTKQYEAKYPAKYPATRYVYGLLRSTM